MKRQRRLSGADVSGLLEAARANRSVDDRLDGDMDAYEDAIAHPDDNPAPSARVVNVRRTQPRQEEFFAQVRQDHPLRMHRLDKDLQWILKKMKRAGLEPEDITWLL